jgi:hypothetical protein
MPYSPRNSKPCSTDLSSITRTDAPTDATLAAISGASERSKMRCER